MLRLAFALSTVALLLPAASQAATYDLNGEWSYSITDLQVTGTCPLGQPSSGKLSITQSGDSFTLVLTSGSVCSPASMCTFSGTVSGATYTGSNTDVVDNEGGTVTNTLTFTAISATAASGTGQSVYQHPQGMTCTWNETITMSRSSGGIPGPDAGVDAGGAPGPDAGAPDEKEKDDGGCSLARSSSGAAALLPLLLLLLGRRRG